MELIPLYLQIEGPVETLNLYVDYWRASLELVQIVVAYVTCRVSLELDDLIPYLDSGVPSIGFDWEVEDSSIEHASSTRQNKGAQLDLLLGFEGLGRLRRELLKHTKQKEWHSYWQINEFFGTKVERDSAVRRQQQQRRGPDLRAKPAMFLPPLHPHPLCRSAHQPRAACEPASYLG